MQIEQVKPNEPSFLRVVLLAGAAILVIIVAAVVIVVWRSHKKETPPYTRHPVSELAAPLHSGHAQPDVLNYGVLAAPV